ncbi:MULTISPECIES: capsule biosynthesis protein [unclassified Methylobacterium]|uniref:capsule biosynthesis protein n=1 Tax=unclassified Methylobacterium TaxID=2615210 RepID=UPI0011C1F48B|nr:MULTISPECIES: capsule biosynthesis protein [unclassified Methylobacterium]QEE40452.1 capsule biosynthesis protein [Methylobacterium sp. WL1]TXM99261.1 capsule biosynthesis protein [Methylobacterium sp. WL64]TXN54292.1 capsule biosynthesis protein [Methylobacterium sp. WL2]
MNMEIRKAEGQPVTTADRQQAITESLRQIARMSRFVDRKKGIRSYQSHVKNDPWIPILFVVCFVLPALAGALYFGLIASDRYVSEARFAIRPALGTADKATPDSVGTSSGVSNQMVAQDTLITYEYILSRPMLEIIESKLPIREWFSRDSIDYFSRFDPDKPIEKFLRYWKRRVGIEVESGSGIMSLQVEAFDPSESLAIAQAVMKEAERMVNDLSVKSREDAVAESTRELKLAEERMTKIRLAMRDLRNREGVLDAQKSNEANLKVVSELRAARINLAVQLAIGQRDLGPESRRIIDIKQQIKDLDENIAKIERQSASQDPEQKRLLSDALTRFEGLENDRKNAEKYYQQVLTAHERARIVAARQIEFFSPIVEPVKAQSSVEPRRMLMISLVTAGAAVLFAASMFARKMMA